jgi:hypothetical protein
MRQRAFIFALNLLASAGLLESGLAPAQEATPPVNQAPAPAGQEMSLRVEEIWLP